jgi:uncharacterized membrane protein
MRKVWIAAAVYAVVFTAFAIYRWHIWSYGSDTGTFAQAILDTGGGFRDGPERGPHFRYHFSPIIALLYPLLALVRSPLALQIAQVVLVALTAPALFALFRPYLEESAATLLSIVALAYAPLASVAFGEFHELAFFPALAICLIWAADRCKWGWFAAISVLLLLTREDVCIELAAVGLGMAVFALVRRRCEPDGLLRGRPRAPIATAIAFGSLGVAAAVTAFAYYHTIFATYGRWPHGHFYDYPFAVGPPAVLAALFTQPAVVLPAIATVGRLTYLLEAFVPLVFLPLRSWWSALALPGLAVVLLASEQSVWRMGNHYAAMWAPWLLVGAGAALMRIRESGGPEAATRWAQGALAMCVLFLAVFNPMHVGHYLKAPYTDLDAARKAFGCVPRSASVSTHDEWFAEIAADYPKATIQKNDGVDYLVYADDFPNDEFQRELRPLVAAGVATGHPLNRTRPRIL